MAAANHAQQAAAPSRQPALGDREFRFLSRLVYEHTRIVLRPEKRDMLAGRLSRRLKALKLADCAEYCAFLASPAGNGELSEFINAVTTNVTGFFREPHHFEHLAKVALPEVTHALAQKGSSRLRLWSAGCSTGQEPYSMAMTLAASLPNRPRWDARILATDIDDAVLAKAKAGIYGLEQGTTIPPDYARRFTRPNQAETFRMTQEIHDLITFKQLNLCNDWPMSGPFDIIFCRNVVIYFDKETQADFFDRAADILADHGWLYIGHSENLYNVTDRFIPAGATTYRKRY